MRWSAALLLVVALPAAAGAALSADERAVFRKEVQNCWNVKGEAVAVTLRFSLDRQGRPDADSVQIISAGTGSEAQVAQSVGAARRAVLRCGQHGYTLPVEKYEQWRDIELTFDPERTILR